MQAILNFRARRILSPGLASPAPLPSPSQSSRARRTTVLGMRHIATMACDSNGHRVDWVSKRLPPLGYQTNVTTRCVNVVSILLLYASDSRPNFSRISFLRYIFTPLRGYGGVLTRKLWSNWYASRPNSIATLHAIHYRIGIVYIYTYVLYLCNCSECQARRYLLSWILVRHGFTPSSRDIIVHTQFTLPT